MRPRHRRFFATLIAVGTLLVGFSGAGVAQGENLVTLSGATYHDARPVSVEPDGVIWRHAEGVVKVDFSDSPGSVREAFHYDPAKAAAYHEEQARNRQRADEQTRQVLQENVARQRARLAQMQTAAAASLTTSSTGAELVFRRARSPAASAATKALGEQMAADKAKQDAALVDATGIVNAKIWSLAPHFGTRLPVVSADTPNTEEYKASFHHAPGGLSSPGGFTPASCKDPALDTTQDSFYQPIYLTKSYYETTDLASAFASGVPLKP